MTKNFNREYAEINCKK